MTQATIGLKTTLHTDYDSALKRVTDALKAEGFGIVTEMDMKDTFKKKLDIDFRPYKILGACNPNLAYRALTATSDVGLLLPCNVTVAQIDDDHIEVSIIDPLIMMSVVSNEAVQPIAHEAHERLSRVIQSLKA